MPVLPIPMITALVLFALLVHRMLTRGGVRFLWAAIWAAIIGLAVLVTFSRGAWLNLAVKNLGNFVTVLF